MAYSFLPDLMLFTDYGNDWPKYLEALYRVFHHDFVLTRPCLNGQSVECRHYPKDQGKEAAFWHLISTGESEDDRLPDIRRCERVPWPRPIIEHTPSDDIKMWTNLRHGQVNICIWLDGEDYLIVLGQRKSYLLFLTAYPVVEDHRKKKLMKEYSAYKASAAHP